MILIKTLENGYFISNQFYFLTALDMGKCRIGIHKIVDFVFGEGLFLPEHSNLNTIFIGVKMCPLIEKDKKENEQCVSSFMTF